MRGQRAGPRGKFTIMRRSVVLALLVVATAAAACSGRGPQAVGAQPSWRGSGDKAMRAEPLRPVTFAPSGQPAGRYNEPVQAPVAIAISQLVLHPKPSILIPNASSSASELLPVPVLPWALVFLQVLQSARGVDGLRQVGSRSAAK